ncbi:ATP-dependent DNA helicase, RecQ-like [Pseudomonas segetis]|uniref:ATP-dependent DNA helicase RecQ n=1 Tax=Pseudomonas segetis TaxID=298908 RepID=A0A239G7K9_9PSED|nr:ATP-dependent DNA helicase, RecQ-like [Pseudomonas segetis]
MLIYDSLHRTFGYQQFRPGQEAAIKAVMAGRSVAAIFPTGSGKSMCYQLPAMHLPHLTLVVSPLLALMQDQLAFLQRHSIKAASIDSAQSREDIAQVMHDAKSGELKVLMISVERLKNERFRNFIQQVPISLLVVDEAHCISEWGHNFRPDYLKLPDYRRQFNIAQVLLLTATATPPVIADMQQKFEIAEADVVTTGFYRPNLNLWVEPVAGADKQRRLVEWLSAKAGQPSIVYVTQQKTAEQVADLLAAKGFPASAYHAGMPHERRESIQRQFMGGQLNCIVATIAFGMGIDKSDIRNVVHYDLPKSIENYSQEIGRAGRDGQPSDCWVMANRDSLNVLENFVYGDTPELEGIGYVLNELLACGADGQWELTFNALSEQSNIRLLALKTLLVQLELRGVIAPKYAYFAEYRFKYLIEPEQLIARFDGERRGFVEALVASSKRARTWCTVDFDQLYQLHQAERSRVIKALDYFQEKAWIELESKQMTEVYTLLDAAFDPARLGAELHRYFKQQEHSEIERIHAMLDLFASDQCLSQRLAGYFGDSQAPVRCGHCSVCQGQVARLPEPPALASLDQYRVSDLGAEFIQRYQGLKGGMPSHECLTRFFCGISVPLLTKLKARSLAGFAALQDYPYAQVREWVEAQV